MAEDLDELLDGPSKGPTRPSRFALKGSKFNLKPKTEPFQLLPPSASDSVELPSKEADSFHLPEKEEPGTVPEHANDTAEMDIEVKPGQNANSEVKKEETV